MIPSSRLSQPADGEGTAISVTHGAAVASITNGRTIPARVPIVEEGPLLGLAELRVLAGFPFRASSRRRRMALSVFTLVMGSVLMLAAFMQRHYRVVTTFLAAPTVVMPALGNPKRAVPTESDAPTRQAAEAVLKRENLLQIIRETNLMATFDATRPPLGRLRDRLLVLVKGPPADSDRVNAMVGLLEKRLWVDTKDRVVTIGIDWMDPTSGFRIVQSAQQNFFEQRHASEVSMIGESIAILEAHVATAEQSIETALGDIRQFTPVVAGTTPAPITIVPRAPRSSPEVASLQGELNARRQTLSDLERSRSQRMAALQARLAELRVNYGPAHPEVISVQDNIRALTEDSPQLTALRRDSAGIAIRLRTLGAHPGEEVPAAAEPTLARAALERLATAKPDSAEDPRVTYAKSRLKIATSDYEDLLDRLEGAHIELETARASFKYQYNIIVPAQIPRRPESPNVPALIVAGIVLASVVTLFVAVWLDLTGGRVVESWQVNRSLRLPIIAEIHHA